MRLSSFHNTSGWEGGIILAIIVGILNCETGASRVAFCSGRDGDGCQGSVPKASVPILVTESGMGTDVKAVQS